MFCVQAPLQQSATLAPRAKPLMPLKPPAAAQWQLKYLLISTMASSTANVERPCKMSKTQNVI